MKYTEEELSRILGEHEAGNLIPGGADNWRQWRWMATLASPVGCANQVAYNESDSVCAFDINPGMAELFDKVYRIGRGVWSDTDALLAALEPE